MKRQISGAQAVRPLLLLLFLVAAPLCALAADDPKDLLPATSCGAGWRIEGKPLFYDADTLSDRIDGEAELYFPYGFDRMATARYASDKIAEAGMDVEIFRVGSLLDAYGMYANYRQKDGHSADIGAESDLSSSQLFFYQGRQFVHIQITGTENASSQAMTACAREVASRMSGKPERPAELSVFDRPEVVKGTERYLPQSLLGYDFLNKGIMADAVVQGEKLRIFFLLPTGSGSASAAMERFRSQLTQAKTLPAGKNVTEIEGMDALYGSVVVVQKDACLAGALKFSAEKSARALLESLCK